MMFNTRPASLVVIIGSIVLAVHAGGADDDDDDDEDLGFGSALSDAFARVKTREIERLIRTAWCVIKGPTCSGRSSRSVTASIPGAESSHEINIEAALNRFSQCICDAASVRDECKLYVALNLNSNDHINVQTSFSLVFYREEDVKDFYCYVNINSVITCDFSQKLIIPISSRSEIKSFVKHIQGEITQKSDCSEFCSRFRCIYESWNDHGLTTPFNGIYEKCVRQMCATTSATPTQAPGAIKTSRPLPVEPLSSVTHFPQTEPYVNHTMILPGDGFNPDAAEQDGADLGSRDSSTLVGGLIGGLLALSLLAFVMVAILLWRRKRKQNLEKRDAPSVTFVSPGQTRIGNSSSSHQGEHTHTHIPAITAVNPLAANGLKSKHGSQSDVKPLTSHRKGSEDDTYATLSECQMSGPHDNLGFVTDKGEELVLAQSVSDSQDFVLEGVYAKPTGTKGHKNQLCDDQYLEPVPDNERYVAMPSQYVEPASETRNDEYLEPVSTENGYAASGPSYMRMESAASGRSVKTEPITDDAQYEQIYKADPNYYNM